MISTCASSKITFRIISITTIIERNLDYNQLITIATANLGVGWTT